MNRHDFDQYIAKFNRRDTRAFDHYLKEGVLVTNGSLPIRGTQGMKEHYAKAWSTFEETIHIERYVSDEKSIAVQMRTEFLAQHDDENSLFGSVKESEKFEFKGIAMYRLEDDKFADILVAYNSFTLTNIAGDVIQLGMPH